MIGYASQITSWIAQTIVFITDWSGVKVGNSWCRSACETEQVGKAAVLLVWRPR